MENFGWVHLMVPKNDLATFCASESFEEKMMRHRKEKQMSGRSSIFCKEKRMTAQHVIQVHHNFLTFQNFLLYNKKFTNK